MPSSQDSRGRSLSIGDRVSWDTDGYGRPTTRTSKGVVQELRVDKDWNDHDNERVRAVIYRSARSTIPDHVWCSELTLLEHGQPISKAAFKAAKERRAQMKADRPFKPTKTHLIAYVMDEAGKPMKRVDILRQVHTMEESEIEFKESSNLDYFSANSAMSQSLLNRGLITITNGRGYSSKEALFALTAEGKKVVKEYRKWLGE